MNNTYHNSYNYSNDTHTHELLGNTSIDKNHNHRIALISSEPIVVSGGHIHEVVSNTSYDGDHIHQINTRSSLQIPITSNKHIHLMSGMTTLDNGHTHNVEIANLLE